MDMEKVCKKCGNKFEPVKGLKSYCSLTCRNSRTWTEEDKRKKSLASLRSPKAAAARERRAAARWKDHDKDNQVKLVKCTNCNDTFESKRNPSGWYPTICSETCKISVKKKNFKGRKFVYKGIEMDSSWEVSIAKHLDKLGIEWTRPAPLNFDFKYYPDFYLPEYNVYLDPKNPLRIEQQKERLDIIQTHIHLIYGSVSKIKKEIDLLLEQL